MKRPLLGGSRERKLMDQFNEICRERAADGLTLLRTLSLDEPARAVEGKPRSFRFVSSTEEPVMTWAGPEVLRMSGARLDRYLRNPVLLDSHRTDSIKHILGTATAEVKHRKLHTEVTLDETPEGEAALARIQSGSLRAMSIRFRPYRNKIRELREGETDGEGVAMVKGPAIVIREWELMEQTLCAVPADEYAVRRNYYEMTGLGRRSATMKFKYTDLGRLSAEGDAPAEGDNGPIEVVFPDRATAERALAGGQTKPAGQEIAEERAARADKARRESLEHRRAAIIAICPTSMRDLGEQLALEGLDVDAARKRLIEEQAKRAAPVGTPDPKKAADSKGDERAALPDDDTLIRSITELRS